VGQTSIANQGLNRVSSGVKYVPAEYERLQSAGVEFLSEPMDMDFGPGVVMTEFTAGYFRTRGGSR
jgi:hypothetical protein